MALQKQLIPMPAVGGIDKGTADALRDPSQLSRGDNIEQLKTGELSKRAGFSEVADGHGTAAATGKAAFPANNALVAAPVDVSSQRTYVYVNGAYSRLLSGTSPYPTMQEWTYESKGFLDFSSAVMDSTEGPSGYIFVLSGGIIYRCDANMNLSGPAYDTGPTLDRGRFVNQTHCVTPLAGLGYRVFTLSDGAAVVSAVNNVTATTTGTASTGMFDAIGTGSGNYLVAYDDGTNIVVDYRDSSNSLTSTINISRTNATSITLSYKSGSSFYVLCVARSAGNSNMYLIALNPMSVTSTGSTGVCYHLAATSGSDASRTYYMKTTGNSTTDVNSHEVSYGDISAWPGSFTISFTATRSQTTLASMPIVSDISVASYEYVSALMSYQSTDDLNLQNSTVLSSFNISSSFYDGKIVASKAPNVNTTLSISNGQYWLPRMALLSDGRYFVPVQSRAPTSSGVPADEGSYVTLGVFLTTMTRADFSKPVIAGQNTLIAANGIMICDGRNYNEFGYPFYPNPTDYAVGAGTLPDNSTYGLATTYEWTDARGNVIESAPAFTSYTRAAAAGAFGLTYTAQTPPFSTHRTWRQNFYRTVPDGSVYYFAGSTTAVATTVADDIAQADLETAKILYTTGGVVENIAPHNSSFIGLAKNRLWTFERGETTTLWFSKKIQDTYLPAFSDLLTLEIPDAGGKLVGVAQLDDKLIVGKQDYIYVLVGDGPSDTLVGEFSEPTAISQGIGFKNARSIVETPIGVFFQGKEGIYLIDRSLQVQFIGRPVYGETDITASVYEPTANKVLFATSSEIWVYFITTGAWYKWTLSGVYDLFLVSGTIYATRAVDILSQSNVWQDDGVNYDQAIKLGQYQFAGMQGYQRLYRMLLTGASTSSTTALTVKTYIDGNTTATDTLSISAANSKSGNRMAFEVRPSIQKCETLELEIIHTGNDEGIKVSAVSAEIGIYPGAGRRASTGRAV